MTAVPKPAPRERRRPKWLPRSTKPIARLWLKRSTKPIRALGRTKVRRLKEYAAHLRSPYWRALRKLVFERDGYRCVDCGMDAGYFVNGKRDIRGLECDHLHYRTWMRETVKDCATRCRDCHRIKHRGGWWKRLPLTGGSNV